MSVLSAEQNTQVVNVPHRLHKPNFGAKGPQGGTQIQSPSQPAGNPRKSGTP